MKELGARLAAEQRAELNARCLALAGDGNWDVAGIEDHSERIASLGIVEMGRLRSSWTLAAHDFEPSRNVDQDQIATFVLATRWIEQVTGTAASVSADGVVEFWREQEFVGSLLFFSGRGVRSWSGIEATSQNYAYRWKTHVPLPSAAIVAGASGPHVEVTAPSSLMAGEDPDSILHPSLEPLMLDLDELRANPERLRAFVR
jgi:hypothetical protein